jgi:hypothetical protein
MRPLVYILSFLAVMALGFWAYRENYETQSTLKEMAAVQDEIASLRESLTIQRAEWAYQNRPARLRALVVANFDKLELLPMEPAQFGTPTEIAYPPPPAELQAAPEAVSPDELGIDAPVAISGELAANAKGQTP